MKNHKPFKVVEERIKSSFINLEFYKQEGLYTFDIMTFIVDGGLCCPGLGDFTSFEEAKSAAVNYIVKYHKSAKQQALLQKFNLILEKGQLELFEI